MPACLPLTVDYYPSEMDLANNYTEAVYFLTLEPPEARAASSSRPFYESEEELLRELVAQRLCQDFQVVDFGSAGANRAGASGSMHYILSMGHRIHVIKKGFNNQIEVKQYLARFGNNQDPGNIFIYNYSLWNPITNEWQKVTRKFVRYMDDHNWNHADQIVQGNRPLTDKDDESAKTTKGYVKFRIIDFVVIPKDTNTTEGEERHIENMLAFIKYLNSRADEDTEMNDVEVLRRRSRKEGAPEPPISYEKWIPKHDIKVCFKNRKNQIDTWLNCNCDTIVDPDKCYHVAIHWLVCTGARVFDFVTAVLRRANSLGLQITQIQHNIRTKALNRHAFQVGAHLAAACPGVRALAEAALLADLGFARDSGQETDWEDYGWGALDSKNGHDQQGHSNNGKSRDINSITVSLAHGKFHKPPRPEAVYDRQYIHCAGAAYVRVAPRGFVWMTNTLTPSNSTYQGLGRRAKQAASRALFRRFRRRLAALAFVRREVVLNLLVDGLWEGGRQAAPNNGNLTVSGVVGRR